MSEDQPATPVKKSFWFWLFSWPVLGAIAGILLSFGGGCMTAAHPYIADVFCCAGILILLVKFWAWEETQHDTTRKSAILLAGGTLMLLDIAVGLCMLSSYLSRPMTAAKQEGDPSHQNLS